VTNGCDKLDAGNLGCHYLHVGSCDQSNFVYTILSKKKDADWIGCRIRRMLPCARPSTVAHGAQPR
jgi:hypothetical protein